MWRYYDGGRRRQQYLGNAIVAINLPHLVERRAANLVYAGAGLSFIYPDEADVEWTG